MHTSDIIAISESRLKDTDKSDDFEIPGFNIYRFDDLNTGNTGRSYRGIVVYSKLKLSEVRRIFSCSDVEAVLVCFNHKNQEYQVVFLYCCPRKASQSFLCKILNQILDTFDTYKPIIVMGDTNEEFFNQNTLSQFLNSKIMHQLVQTMTTDYGSCLDHLYTNMMSYDEVSCATLESYYSDHKPIVAYLPVT